MNRFFSIRFHSVLYAMVRIDTKSNKLPVFMNKMNSNRFGKKIPSNNFDLDITTDRQYTHVIIRRCCSVSESASGCCAQNSERRNADALPVHSRMIINLMQSVSEEYSLKTRNSPMLAVAVLRTRISNPRQCQDLRTIFRM